MSKPALQRWLELLSRLSLDAQYRLAVPIAAAVANTPNQISRQARTNIDSCFADLELAERNRLYREAIRHTCYAMTELGAVWCWPVDRVLESIRTFDICEEFEQTDRARIILAPHLGSWETLALWLGYHCQAIMLYKRFKKKRRETEQYMIQTRSRSGGKLVSTRKHGLRELLVGLKKGRSLMVLPDQKPGNSKARIASTFFGHSAPTTALVHSLCSRIDCDVFIASALRTSPPGGFEIYIRPLQHARLAADEIGSAQYMNDQIEKLVRTRPSQYQWGYDRFDFDAVDSSRDLP